jgi:hypothetical protein
LLSPKRRSVSGTEPKKKTSLTKTTARRRENKDAQQETRKRKQNEVAECEMEIHEMKLPAKRRKASTTAQNGEKKVERQ